MRSTSSLLRAIATKKKGPRRRAIRELATRRFDFHTHLLQPILFYYLPEGASYGRGASGDEKKKMRRILMRWIRRFQPDPDARLRYWIIRGLGSRSSTTYHEARGYIYDLVNDGAHPKSWAEVIQTLDRQQLLGLATLWEHMWTPSGRRPNYHSTGLVI